jgi:hypothetical protein
MEEYSREELAVQASANLRYYSCIFDNEEVKKLNPCLIPLKHRRQLITAYTQGIVESDSMDEIEITRFWLDATNMHIVETAKIARLGWKYMENASRREKINVLKSVFLYDEVEDMSDKEINNSLCYKFSMESMKVEKQIIAMEVTRRNLVHDAWDNVIQSRNYIVLLDQLVRM